MAQHQPGHVPRQLARELGAAAAGEQVDHRDVVVPIPRSLAGFGRGLRNLDPVPPLAENE
jgi:hypothetical protein